MENNGSPPPEFESDEDRTYFLIRLPVHERAKGGTGQVTPQVTPHVTPQVRRLLAVLEGELLRDELQERLGIADRKYLRLEFLVPAMEAGLVEMTIPDKPRSSKQRYRLTDLGRRSPAEIASRNPDAAERDAE
jgi:ATP-dependent DNA helicase RecG